ncbi:MAG TPA: methyl-accepting chemotaxis protein [Kineosporiaceae bacterium]|nr:methyl-accepting chemotaxis protein [Kineosporiaceae bacterium]
MRFPLRVAVSWVGFRSAGGSAPDGPAPGGGWDPNVLRRMLGRAGDLALAAEDLGDSVGLIASTAQDSAHAVRAANTASRELSTEAVSVARAAERMSAAMTEVASSAAAATTVTAAASSVTQKVQSSVDHLLASASQIDGVVATVTAVSDQTRLLALNATIEAARAGEAGKGFAVVANEVKQLAGETNDATTRITGQLSQLAQDSEQVRQAVAEIAGVLTEVERLQQTIAAAVQEQSDVIAEVTRAAGHAASAAGDLDNALESSTHATQAADAALGRARSWLDRLSSAASGQQAEITGLGSGLAVHPVRAGISAHVAWKKRLRTAIETRRLEPGTDLATVARDDACPFGKWIHGDAAGEPDRNRVAEVTRLHAAFHRGAADVLRAVVNGDSEEAVRLMGAEDSYGGAAARLTDLLLDWVREVESDTLSELYERRAAPRIPIALVAALTAGNRSGSLRLHDLSETGAAGTVTGLALSPGLQVRIDLPYQGGRLPVSARVVRAGGDGQIATEFADLSAADREALRTLLAAQA